MRSGKQNGTESTRQALSCWECGLEGQILLDGHSFRAKTRDPGTSLSSPVFLFALGPGSLGSPPV